MTHPDTHRDLRGHLAGPDGCWSWDATHWPCAVALVRAQDAELDRLRAENEQLRRQQSEHA